MGRSRTGARTEGRCLQPCSRSSIPRMADVMPNRVLRKRVLGMLSGNSYEFQNHTRNPPTMTRKPYGAHTVQLQRSMDTHVSENGVFTLTIAGCVILSSQSCLLSAYKQDFSAQHRSQ